MRFLFGGSSFEALSVSCCNLVEGSCKWARLDGVGLKMRWGGGGLSLVWSPPTPPTPRYDASLWCGPALDVSWFLVWTGVGRLGHKPAVVGSPLVGCGTMELAGRVRLAEPASGGASFGPGTRACDEAGERSVGLGGPAEPSGCRGDDGHAIRCSPRLALREGSTALESAVARKARFDDCCVPRTSARKRLSKKKVSALSRQCGVSLSEGEADSLSAFAALRS